jgi:hypothetical protein
MAQMYAAPAGMLSPAGETCLTVLARTLVVGWGVTSKRAAMERGRRQARLRPEYAVLYPGIPAEEWKPIGELLDCVAAARLRAGRRSGELLRGRLLDDRHFDFRGGGERPPGRSGTRTRVTDFEQPPRV